MKKYFVLFFLLVAFCTYAQKLNIPAKINASKTDAHRLIRGTHLHMRIPPQFDAEQKMAFNQTAHSYSDDSVSVTIKEFNEPYSHVRTRVVASNAPSWKEISVNGFEGTYIESPPDSNGVIANTLLFGDETFGVVITGACENTASSKAVLSDVLTSVVYDKSTSPGAFDLAGFEFDQQITGLKWVPLSRYIFTKNGRGSDYDSQLPTIFVDELNYVVSDEKADTIFSKIFSQNFTIADKTYVPLDIGGGRMAWVNESKITQKGKDGIMYVAIVPGDKKTVVFRAHAFSEPKKYLAAFKKTVESIKFR